MESNIRIHFVTLLSILFVLLISDGIDNTCSKLGKNHKSVNRNLINYFQDITRKVGRDTLLVSKYNSKADYSDLPAAYNALPLTGGTIILDNIHLGDVPYTGKIDIKKPNVSLIGVCIPKIDWNTDTIANDTPRIEGKVSVTSSGFMAQNIVFQSIVVEDDALVLSTINRYRSGPKGDLAYSRRAKIDNCIFIGKTRYSLFHCLLVENYDSVTIKNIATLCNVWGVALKASNLTLKGLKSKNHDFGPVIAKADNGKTVENIQIEDVNYFSTLTVAGAYKGNVMAQNYSADSHLRNVTFKNISIKNGGFQLSTPNNSPLDGIQNLTVENLIVDNSQNTTLNCINLTGNQCTGKILISNAHLKGGAHSIYDATRAFQNIHIIDLTADKAIQADIFKK